MALQVASLYGTLDLQDNMTPGLDAADKKAKGFGTSLSGTLSNASKGLMDFGKTMTIGVTLPIVAGFGAAVNAAETHENALTQLRQVLISTGGAAGVTSQQVQDLAKSFEVTTRFTDDQVISGENLLLTFTKIGKDTFPLATQTMLDMSQALGQDMKSSAIQLGKALSDPEKGITSLTRVGVTFTAQQKEMIKQMEASGNMAGAQQVILQELQREFGGSAQAAGGTFAGQLDILQHRFNDLLVTIGNMLMPILQQGMDFLGNFIGQLNNLGPGVLQTGIVIAGIAAAIGPLATALGFLISPLGLLAAGAALVGAAWVTNFGGIRDVVMPILQNLQAWFTKDALPAIISFVQTQALPAIQGFFNWLGTAWTVIQPALVSVYNWFISTGLPLIRDYVTKIVLPEIQGFFNFISGAWNLISPALTSFFNWFTSTGLPAVQSAVGDFKDKWLAPAVDILTTIWKAVQPALDDLHSWFTKTGLPEIQSIIDGLMKNYLKPLIDSLSGIWTNASPGLQDIEKWFHDNFAAIQITIDAVTNSITNFVSGVLNAIDQVANLGKGVHGQVSGFDKNSPAGKFTGGFASGGYTGDAPSNQIVGAVHGREWVVPEKGALVVRGDSSPSNMTITLNVTEGNAKQAGINFADGLATRMRGKGLAPA